MCPVSCKVQSWFPRSSKGQDSSLENSRSHPWARPWLEEHGSSRSRGGGGGLLVISIMHCSQENSYARPGTMSLSQYISSALPSDRLCRRGSGAIQPPTKTPPPRPQPLPQFSLAPLITLTSDFEIGETAALKAGLGRAACDLNLLFISQRAGSVNRTRNITAPAVILCHRDQKASRPSRITFLLWAPKHLLIQAL